MARCEFCEDHGGQVYCRLLDRGVPTAGTGEPVRPDDCPNLDITNETCEDASGKSSIYPSEEIAF